MSTIKSSNEHLTLNADGSSKDIKFQANGVEKASISSAGAFTSTTIDATALTGNLPAISGASLTNVNAVNTGRKNLIINGAMNVAQRGTSETGYTTDKWLLDRFIHEKASATGTFTMTQEADAPDGFKNSLKVDCTTAGTGGDYNAVHTRLEAQDLSHLAYGTSSAKSVTLSFWVKVSQTGTQQFNLLHYADAGTRQISATYTINAANTWEKKTITFAGDTVRANDDDNSKGFVLEWFLSSYGTARTGTDMLTSWGSYTNTARFDSATILIGDSTSDTWQITGVQLEIGDTATDFEHRSYGEELALCQRYYQILVDGGADKAIGVGFYWSSNEVDYTHRFVTDMRAAPTLEQVTGTDYYRMSANNDSFNGFSGIQYTSTRSCNMYASSNVSGTAGFASDIRSRNAESFIAFTAEL